MNDIDTRRPRQLLPVTQPQDERVGRQTLRTEIVRTEDGNARSSFDRAMDHASQGPGALYRPGIGTVDLMADAGKRPSLTENLRRGVYDAHRHIEQADGLDMRNFIRGAQLGLQATKTIPAPQTTIPADADATSNDFRAALPRSSAEMRAQLDREPVRTIRGGR